MIKTKNVGVHLRHISEWKKRKMKRNFFWNSIRRLLALLNLFLFLLVISYNIESIVFITTKEQQLKKVLLLVIIIFIALVIYTKGILIYLPNLSISHEFLASLLCMSIIISFHLIKKLLFEVSFTSSSSFYFSSKVFPKK